MRGLSDLEPEDRRYVQRRFGSTFGLLVGLVVNVREMRKVEEMLEGSDRTIMSFKDGRLNAVGSLSVAAAIISQLSSTTLQMPGLSNVHWTAPGLIIASLLFSVLGVIVSCVQQQILGTLNNPEGVRMWLSNGHFYPPHSRCHPRYDERVREADGDSGRCESHAPSGVRSGLSRPAIEGKRRLQVSIAAMQLLSLPHKFLSAGVVCFLAGFALYLGFAYRQDLDDTPARNNNEAVFIMFLSVASVVVLGGLGTSFWKMWEVGTAEQRLERDMEYEQDSSQEWDGSSGESGYEGDSSTMLPRRGERRGNRWGKHQEIAEALESAAKTHRRVARLMREDS